MQTVTIELNSEQVEFVQQNAEALNQSRDQYIKKLLNKEIQFKRTKKAKKWQRKNRKKYL